MEGNIKVQYKITSIFKTHCVILQIIPVKKFQLLFWIQIREALAEKVDFLLYEPSPQILPLRHQWKGFDDMSMQQLHSQAHISVAILKKQKNADSRLAVGESENEVGDVVLPPPVTVTWPLLRLSVILIR